MTRSFAALRERAVQHLSAQHLRAAGETEATRLVEELAVAYGELELQADELRITQVALERAHRHYAGLYRNAPVAFLVLDLDGEILEFNQAANEMLDLHRTRTTRISDLLVGDRTTLDAAMTALSQGGRAEAEWHLRTRGETLTVRAHLAPRVEGDGALASLIDVTALRAAELTQRRLATRLGALVQSSRDGIVVFDARTWMTLETNHAFVEMLGATQDLVGAPLPSLFAADHRAVGEQCLRQHLAAVGGLFRLTFQTADGPADLEALLSRVDDDVELTAMLVVRDDRDRRRLEGERMQLQERTLHAQKLEALGRLAFTELILHERQAEQRFAHRQRRWAGVAPSFFSRPMRVPSDATQQKAKPERQGANALQHVPKLGCDCDLAARLARLGHRLATVATRAVPCLAQRPANASQNSRWMELKHPGQQGRRVLRNGTVVVVNGCVEALNLGLHQQVQF
jgi:PAS domain S-box-containing protein